MLFVYGFAVHSLRFAAFVCAVMQLFEHVHVQPLGDAHQQGGKYDVEFGGAGRGAAFAAYASHQSVQLLR